MGSLSDRLPAPLRPAARRAGLETRRLRLAVRELELTARRRLGRAIKHLHGDPEPRADEDSLLVLCTLRNAMAWLPTFLRYHRELGARHFVFVDNDSTDRTRELLGSQPDVTLFHAPVSFARYKIPLKRWLVNSFGRGGWILVADVDELFDFPHSKRLGLRGFLRYLNENDYTAVAVHNLEMLSEEPLADIQGRSEDDLEPLYPWYDVSAIRRVTDKYWLRMNRFDSEAHCMHTGGIRESAFGWTGSMLTRHALLRPDERMCVYPYDGHFVTGAQIADVTALFKHYKFIGSFYEHMEEAIRRGAHHNDSRIFKRYAKVLEENPRLLLVGPEARRYGAAEELLDQGFLLASHDYRRWVDGRAPEDVASERSRAAGAHGG